MFEAAASTDRLIELILEEDKDVLKELLTTQKIVISGKDRTYFNRRLTKDEIATARNEKTKAEEFATFEIAEERKILTKEVNALEAQVKESQSDKSLKKILSAKQKELKALIKKMTDIKRKAGSKITTN
jgi:hypothetical protein